MLTKKDLQNVYEEHMIFFENHLEEFWAETGRGEGGANVESKYLHQWSDRTPQQERDATMKAIKASDTHNHGTERLI